MEKNGLRNLLNGAKTTMILKKTNLIVMVCLYVIFVVGEEKKNSLIV